MGSVHEASKVPISLVLMHGTAKDMLVSIKRLYGNLVQLPSRRATENIRDSLRLHFMGAWGVENIPCGMRISLVKAVEYVGRVGYGLESLEGARIDIWGDGMERGNQPIVRLCFRFLGCQNAQVQFKCQSRDEIFTFAVFYGKDSHINMERNLMSFKKVGGKGWLYHESQHLVEVLKVHLTVSGDVPWSNKLVIGHSVDSHYISTAGMWYPDPIEDEIERVCRTNKVTRKTLVKLTPSHNLQREMCEIGCVLPQGAFFGQPDDPRNGYRTQIEIAIDQPMPETSMIYLKSRAHVCPDGFHASVRIAEKDVKLICEFLLEKGRVDNFKRFEKNINDRGVHNPHFSFTFKAGNTLNNAKEIAAVKFSGEDARVLIANHSQLEGSLAGPLFDGVFNYDRLVPHCNALALSILTHLHADLALLDSERIRGISERTAIELMFTAHNEISNFYRDPMKTNEHVEELEKWVETYYQTNLLLFPIDKAFTPYKAKLLVLPRLLRTNQIHCLFEHLTEGTENSNHGTNRIYHNHSMRDGGLTEMNVSSEFHDLFHSFTKCITLGIERQTNGGSNPFDFLEVDTDSSQNWRAEYLTICRTPLPKLELDIGKKVNIFRGIRFYFCDTFEKVPPLKLKNKSKKITKSVLTELATEMNGTVLADLNSLSESHSGLQHCYVVLQNDKLLKRYENRSSTTEPLPQCFLQSTRGDFIYINVDYILRSYTASELLDPAPYVFNVNRTHFVRSTAKNTTAHMQRQRLPADGTEPGPILAKTALKRSRSASKHANIPTCAPNPSRPRRIRKCTNNRSSNITVAKLAYHTFYKTYFEQQAMIDTDENGKVNVANVSRNASAYWKSNSQIREQHFREARQKLGVSSPASASISIALSEELD
jgi:hypothetical protein